MMILPSVLTLRSVESSHFESSSKPWAELPKCQDDIRFKWLCVVLVKLLLQVSETFSLKTMFGSCFRWRLVFITRCLPHRARQIPGEPNAVNTTSTAFFSHVVIYSTELLELKSCQWQSQKWDLIWDFFWPGLCRVGICAGKDLAGVSSLLVGMSWCSVWFNSVSSATSPAGWPSTFRACCLPPSFKWE